MTRPRFFVVFSFIIVLMRTALCLGEWGQPDPDVAGLPLDKLVSTSESCNLTSKGREFQVMESREYFEDLAVRKLKVSAAILKDEGEKTMSEFLRVIDLAQKQKEGEVKFDDKIRAWLEQNCAQGRTLYLYSRHSDKLQRTGYCVVSDGVVTSSFVLGEGPVISNEPDFAVPANFSVAVNAVPIQPADIPVVITIKVTITGNAPYRYWCGGPGAYLEADIFTAKVVGSDGKTQGIRLQNGQYTMGSGTFVEIKLGETVEVPASLGILPAGDYTIQVGAGPAVKVEVKTDQQLAQKRSNEILDAIYRQEPFPKVLAVDYHLKPVIDALQRDLAGTDLAKAQQAVATLDLIHPKPDGLATTIRQAMDQQVSSTTNSKARFLFIMQLTQMAAGVGSDEMLEPVLHLLACDTTHIPNRGMSLDDLNLEDAKVTAVRCLAWFKQQRATEELHSLLKDSHLEIRTTAAWALAKRKDPVGKEILRAQVFDKEAVDRSALYSALLDNFPDDPGYEALIKFGLVDSNDDIQRAAKKVQEKREKVQALRDGK